ncbi:hypothetical protein C1646_809884 [Rhizophagus diaphanus]|nr:hypothetical protein C1646_809884 [Rhizophagus diaphanus] [Rhizophagus sp. MUCL 43196]
MTETAGQLLAHVVPACQWLPQNSTIPAYPRFPVNVREWAGFRQAVRTQLLPPEVQLFPVFPTNAQPLRVEANVKTRFQNNVSWPVGTLLQLQRAVFDEDNRGLLVPTDFVLRTNDQLPKMPVEIKTRHNLHLRGYNFWEIYRSADRRNIRDPNFKFKKRILSQIFEADPITLQLAINDVIGLRLGCVLQDNDSSNNDDSDDSSHDDPDDPNDSNYSESSNDDSSDDDGANYSRKRKRKQSSVGRRTSSSKRIAIISEYIGGGSFGQVFSGYYDNQAAAWKTCDTYKKQEEMKTLKHEAHIYSVLKECQGYIYDRCLFALALQLIEDSHYIDPTILTKEEKVNQLKSIHNFGVLHNDISNKNILYEPTSHQFFFIDFGLSEIVDNESPKLRKEEKRLKKLLQLLQCG